MHTVAVKEKARIDYLREASGESAETSACTSSKSGRGDESTPEFGRPSAGSASVASVASQSAVFIKKHGGDIGEQLKTLSWVAPQVWQEELEQATRVDEGFHGSAGTIWTQLLSYAMLGTDMWFFGRKFRVTIPGCHHR